MASTELADLVAEFGIEAVVLARLEVELDLLAAAGIEGAELEETFWSFTAGLFTGLKEVPHAAD